MFIQQPIRVIAEPLEDQGVPVLLDAHLRRHFTQRAVDLSNEVVQVLRVDVVDAILIEQQTQADILLSVETDTLDFFDSFLLSFTSKEAAEEFVLVSVLYNPF